MIVSLWLCQMRFLIIKAYLLYKLLFSYFRIEEGKSPVSWGSDRMLWLLCTLCPSIGQPKNLGCCRLCWTSEIGRNPRKRCLFAIKSFLIQIKIRQRTDCDKECWEGNPLVGLKGLCFGCESKWARLESNIHKHDIDGAELQHGNALHQPSHTNAKAESTNSEGSLCVVGW